MIPGMLRGVIAAIMWFGFQTYAGSQALSILIAKLWPPFLTLGGNWNLLGLSLPALIAFIVFWLFNVALIYGGMKFLGKFTNILSPLVYIVFGGMAIWAINLAGGIGPILAYTGTGSKWKSNCRLYCSNYCHHCCLGSSNCECIRLHKIGAFYKGAGDWSNCRAWL